MISVIILRDDRKNVPPIEISLLLTVSPFSNPFQNPKVCSNISPFGVCNSSQATESVWCQEQLQPECAFQSEPAGATVAAAAAAAPPTTTQSAA